MIRIIPYGKVFELDGLLKEYPTENTRFIVPSRRDRDWWRARTGTREFGLEAAKADAPWNWEDLYNNLCAYLERPCLRQTDPSDHRLILSHIVREFLKEERALTEKWPGVARPGFIDILSDDIRELINEDISPEQLKDATGDGNPASLALSGIYRRYLDALTRNNLMDSAQIPQKARALLAQTDRQWCGARFAFVGFMSFTHAQLHFIHDISERCPEVVVFKPESGLKGFQDAETQLEGRIPEELFSASAVPTKPNETPETGTIVCLSAADFSLEAETVARNLALWQAGQGFLSESLSGVPDRNSDKNSFPGFGAAGIMVPACGAAVMETALRRYCIPFTLARGRSILETPAGALLSPLRSAWVQGLETGETALLLTHPCLAGPSFPVDAAILAGPRGVKGWEDWLKSGQETKTALKAFRSAVKFSRVLEKGAIPADLFQSFHAFLTTPGLWLDALASPTLSRMPDLDESLRELASAIAEVNAKRLAMSEMQPDLGVAGKTPLAGGEALAFLADWCKETLVTPAPPTGGAMTLYTAPPPVLASWPVWIVTGLSRKNWPGNSSVSPLLGAEERERMREASAWLPSAHDRRMQREALFRRLMQTGDRLTITSHAATDEDGRPDGGTPLMDPFLTDMNAGENPWRRIDAPVTQAGSLMASDEAPYFPSIEVRPSEKAERGMPRLRVPERDLLRFALSDLRDLLDCPFRWRLQRAAKLNERRRLLLHPLEAGLLTHKIWENVWKRKAEELLQQSGTALDTALTLPALAAEEWKQIRAKNEDYVDFGHLVSNPKLKRQIQNLEFYVARLAGLQQDILERLALSGLRHTAIYVEDMKLEAETDGVLFTGRCDRVEVFNDRYAVITDYKLGKSASSEKKFKNLAARRYIPEELTEGREEFRFGLQLSAYALLYGRRFPDHEAAGVAFLGHADGTLSGTFSPALSACYLPGKKTQPQDERMKEAETALRCAAAVLKSGVFEPCYIAESCRFCDMKGVCRKGELRGESLLPPDEENENEDEANETN